MPPQGCPNLYIVDYIAREGLHPAPIIEGAEAGDQGWTWRFDPFIWSKMDFSKAWESGEELARAQCRLAFVWGAQSKLMTGDVIDYSRTHCRLRHALRGDSRERASCAAGSAAGAGLGPARPLRRLGLNCGEIGADQPADGAAEGPRRAAGVEIDHQSRASAGRLGAGDQPLGRRAEKRRHRPHGASLNRHGRRRR